MVIGSRMLYPHGMWSQQRLANWTADVVTNLLFGSWALASQSGLWKTIPGKALSRLLSVQSPELDGLTAGRGG
jgi:hypothetical protein